MSLAHRLATPEQKIAQAKTALALNHPWFAMILYMLRFQQSTDMTTLATNGTHLYWNYDFVNSLSVVETVAGIAHEILHCVFKHITLPKGYNAELWNIACDLVINHLLRQWGFILPQIAIFEFQGVTGSNKNAFQVYAELLKVVPTKPSGGHAPTGDDGSNIQVPAGSDDILAPGKDDQGNPLEDAKSSEELNIDWEMATAAATEEAQRVGKLPAGLEVLVEAMLEPKVNWVAATRQWLIKDNTVKNWNRFKKRWFGNGIYLPKKHNEKLGNGILVLDTSSSCTEQQEAEFASETSYLLRELRPDELMLICCDTKVYEPQILTQKDLPLKELKIHGRGGTKFLPAFEYVESLPTKPNWLIYFTDLDVHDKEFSFEPDYPVLWVSNNRSAKAPWGKTVYI